MTPVRDTKVKLEINAGPLKGKDLTFQEKDAVLLGRDPQCHLCIPGDSYISRYHCIFEIDPPKAWVKDLGSLNGTQVERLSYTGPAVGRPNIQTTGDGIAVPLNDGDRVIAGQTQVCVRVEDPTVYGPQQVCRVCGKRYPAMHFDSRSVLPTCPACRATTPGGQIRFTLDAGPDFPSQGVLDAFQRLGYSVVSKLGEGGMGVVFLAERLSDQQQVALKVIRLAQASSDRCVRMFLRETDILKQVRHPHIVALNDSGHVETTVFIEMEYCDAGTVADAMAQSHGKLPLPAALTIAIQAMHGLAYAHERGYVHRDIKPGNILLRKDAGGVTAKLADFGLAKSFEKAGLSGITETGEFGGTFAFMPRDQLINYRYASPAGDVWSMAATLYYMITAAHPREQDNGKDPIAAILSGDTIPLCEREPAVPVRLAEVIEHALAVEPKDRFESARFFRDELTEAARAEGLIHKFD